MNVAFGQGFDSPRLHQKLESPVRMRTGLCYYDIMSLSFSLFHAKVKAMKRPHIVVGREKDLEAIKMQFDVLLEGCWALAVIAGETGIGKTTLVKKAMADLSLVNGTCVYGKFDQYNGNQPYVTIIQILEQITGHLLTLPEDKLGRVRTKLVQNLGLDRILLTGMVPQIRGILGHRKGCPIPRRSTTESQVAKSHSNIHRRGRPRAVSLGHGRRRLAMGRSTFLGNSEGPLRSLE